MPFSFFTGKPQNVDYSYDDSDYDQDSDEYDAAGDEADMEQAFSIDPNFTIQGQTITVDKGTTIKLPCYVDEFPSTCL